MAYHCDRVTRLTEFVLEAISSVVYRPSLVKLPFVIRNCKICKKATADRPDSLGYDIRAIAFIYLLWIRSN